MQPPVAFKGAKTYPGRLHKRPSKSRGRPGARGAKICPGHLHKRPNCKLNERRSAAEKPNAQADAVKSTPALHVENSCRIPNHSLEKESPLSLAFENVELFYDKLHVLHRLSLHIRSGESLAIIGPSGCGKSSMLRLAAGLLSPSEGCVLVDDARIEKPRRQTALILQNFGLLPWKTAYANAELGLRIQKAPVIQRRERTLEALQRVGLQDFATHYPAQLSGGMQQRLAIARALACDIDMLLMDEPTSALDALLREELQDALLGLWREKRYTQVLVTHSIEEAVYLGQRIVVLAARPGRAIACIDNPLMGSAAYRTSREFFLQCKAVRDALERACNQVGMNRFSRAERNEGAHGGIGG